MIDDEPDVLQIICDVLEMEGFKTVCLASASTARRWARSSSAPALFLMDVMLPGMSGIDLAREFRAGEFPDTPMIAMSASASMLDAAARSTVFEETMPKPFELSSLLQMVGRYAP